MAPRDIFTPEQARLAAARFRASEEMYHALCKVESLLAEFWKRYTLSDCDEEETNETMKSIRAAIAMADNTNETLPL